MNCNHCRYQLSQCLDGRLPSGQRASAMQHVEQCRECREFWDDLQAAQALTLRLQRPHVGPEFREGLWDRIRAGEGTPEAVFHEPVPVWTKVRYAATGAAAAAAVLLGLTWLQHDRDPAPGRQTPVARVVEDTPVDVADAPGVDHPTNGDVDAVLTGSLRDRSPRNRTLATGSPLIAATQPLTVNLVAGEAARQLEQRHFAVNLALRRLADPHSNRDAAISQAIENAEDFRVFGELLLDLRDANRLAFRDDRIDESLRHAVQILSRGEIEDRGDGRLRLIETIVAPALHDEYLGHVARTILVPTTVDRREEIDALAQLNRRRPEVFPKLFFVFGNADGIEFDATPLPPGMAFVMQGVCGPTWVAPRSEVEALDGLLRMLPGQMIEVHMRDR